MVETSCLASKMHEVNWFLCKSGQLYGKCIQGKNDQRDVQGMWTGHTEGCSLPAQDRPVLQHVRLGHVFHMFGPAHAHLAELLNMHSIVFKRHGEASSSTIQMPDYGAEVHPCHALACHEWAWLRHGSSSKMVGPAPTTAGSPSNGWPSRHLRSGKNTSCMLAIGLSWACTTCPWMGFTQTHLQSSSNTAACSTARAWCQRPGKARGHGTRWGIPEGLLWLHAHHQVGVGVH